MGFLGFGKKKRGPPPAIGRTKAQRRNQVLDEVEHVDPELYRQLIIEEAFPGRFKPKQGPPTMYEQLADLKDLIGLIGDIGGKGKGRKGDDDTPAMLEALSKFNPVIQGFLASRGLSTPPAEQPKELTAGGESTAPGEEPMSLMVTFVTNQLESRTAAQAAAWLTGLNDQFAQQVIERVRTTPDNDVVQRIQELSSLHPEARQLTNWLLALPRREWLMALVREIKAQPAAGAAVKGL